MGTLLVTGPTIEPVTYQEIIAHLRMNPIDEEIDEALITYIENLIKAVRQDAEDFTNRKFITQTWKYYLDAFPVKDYIELPFNPVQSVSSVKYTDTDGTVTPMTVTTDYLVDTVSLKAKIVLPYLGSWPTATLHPVNPIEIEFICGYSSLAENIDRRITQAILVQVADLYGNRETLVQGQPIQRLDIYERLLGPYQLFFFG
jgi:uncharacterized phiE125 gp8 family phage protein